MTLPFAGIRGGGRGGQEERVGSGGGICNVAVAGVLS